MTHIRIERPTKETGKARLGGWEKLIYVADDGAETDITDAGWVDLQIGMKPGELEKAVLHLMKFEIVETQA